MQKLISHQHIVHFTLCKHTYRKYVFDPDPDDPSRCVCPKIDPTEYPFEEAVPGHSGKIYNRQFKQRIIRGRCKPCKDAADAHLAVLSSVEEGWDMTPWTEIDTGGVGWNDPTENWETMSVGDLDAAVGNHQMPDFPAQEEAEEKENEAGDIQKLKVEMEFTIYTDTDDHLPNE
ncbi:hypothetical protein H072_3694 [Dactylellina haptotyla CBS 200.50]|uniref:Uncharacterized protein n=1 Tax=Dactylellina haptotyla (strain CBS 200.50) TaxID=1284197 RepID=S8AHM2_DACHA|nr:hypothetical protein H072_3694 [Dactylellina haptotyla CBS 200.50]